VGPRVLDRLGEEVDSSPPRVALQLLARNGRDRREVHRMRHLRRLPGFGLFNGHEIEGPLGVGYTARMDARECALESVFY